MTDAEKKMKKYVNAVERRLNLPREIKVRVMSDFQSSITARREAGQSDAEIFEDLGNPRQAAATLNEQMKEYTYHKSPWRFLFAAAAAYGGAELLESLIGWLTYFFLSAPIWSTGKAGTVGIIGGADGPTAIFVTTPGWLSYAGPCLMLILGIWGFLRLRKCKRK